jgi:hypothetical protein
MHIFVCVLFHLHVYVLYNQSWDMHVLQNQSWDIQRARRQQAVTIMLGKCLEQVADPNKAWSTHSSLKNMV